MEVTEIKENLIRIISSLHEEVCLGVFLYFTDEEAEIIADFLIKNGVNISKEAHLKYVGENIISDIERSAYKNAEGDLFISKSEFEKIQKKYTEEGK